ncbi:MAG: family 20 glycosylhydrolase [Deltaproteobacteria bacterium]|nr:family 20 glycosylhydrolase [Deltaproteobacteria bacterium]
MIVASREDAVAPVREALARAFDLDGRTKVVPPTEANAVVTGDARDVIALVLEASDAATRDPSLEPPSATDEESYRIHVDGKRQRIVARAPAPAGLFYAAQHLAQLAGCRAIEGSGRLAPRPIPEGVVVEEPRFRVRPMHLDVARHFFDKKVVERYVDLIAFYKYNVFHWHLTDDQGFRLPVRSHPELTASGPSYTEDDVREVVAYAKSRFVTVVPEVEMPGHARAILASHPELSCTGVKQPIPTTWGVFDDVLCAGNPATYTLLADVLHDTTRLFPSKWIHVGGDEVPKGRWNACPKCRAKMAADGIGAEALQGSFMRRVHEMLKSDGRRMVAWDDVLEGGIPSDTLVVAWQGGDRPTKAARADHDVLVAPTDTTYFNFWQSKTKSEPGHEGYTPWQKVFSFDPLPSGLDARATMHVLGAEGTLWTEYVTTRDELDTLLLPRLAALSDVSWRRGRAVDDTALVERWGLHRPMLDAAGVRYFVEPPIGLRAKKVFLDTARLDLALSRLFEDGTIRYTTDGSEPSSSSPVYSASQRPTFDKTTDVAARVFLAGGRTSPVVRGRFERGNLSPARSDVSISTDVTYKYYEGNFERLPDFKAIVPRSTGVAPSLSARLPGFRSERYAVLFETSFQAPKDGVYRFVASADDGIAVDVDGIRVLEDDGEHAARETDGDVALAAGMHRVVISYFQGKGGASLSLRAEAVFAP